jgi:hypothetical protein
MSNWKIKLAKKLVNSYNNKVVVGQYTLIFNMELGEYVRFRLLEEELYEEGYEEREVQADEYEYKFFTTKQSLEDN